MAKAGNIISRTLGLFSIWAIGVGLVISGESFGWNYGWDLLGPKGFLVPVITVAIMYFFLTKSLTELACVYPNAEGPHTYAKLAFGQIFGDFVAIATLIEFLFATPAIANAIGQYLNFLSPEVFNIKITSIILILLFCLINYFTINVTAKFMIILTVIAITELLLFIFSISPNTNIDNFIFSSFDNYSFKNIVKAMPYAIWLFLGLEGVSLLSQNIDKKKYVSSISKGYFYSFLTLFILALSVLFFAGSSFNWTESTWKQMTVLNDHPLPFVLKLSMGANNPLVQLFTFIGLGGLVASLQGLILASLNQTNFLLNPMIGKVKIKKNISSLVVILVGSISIWFETTGFLIELSVFGAVCIYISTSASLIRLRNKNNFYSDVMLIESEKLLQHSDFSSILSTLSSVTVILISSFCFISLVYQHYDYFVYFLIIVSIYIVINSRKKQNG
jgi:ethanolamine permease